MPEPARTEVIDAPYHGIITGDDAVVLKTP